jgi:hypothetical protein
MKLKEHIAYLKSLDAPDAIIGYLDEAGNFKESAFRPQLGSESGGFFEPEDCPWRDASKPLDLCVVN